MCVKLPLIENWIPALTPHTPINTYTCRVTIALRVCGGVLVELKLFEKDK